MIQAETDTFRPMKVAVFNAILEDFDKVASLNQTTENQLREKYKQLPSATIGSILSSLVQRSMKQVYRKSAAISSRYYELYERAMKERDKDDLKVIVSLAVIEGICPALFARSLLQHVYPDPIKAKKCIKDTTLIHDKDLALQVFTALLNDNQYGPYSDVIKQSIGLEYELKLERALKEMDISFSDENVLRSRGYDKTPDFKLDLPIAVDGFIIHWVESKALFGDEENHAGYLKDQLSCYWNRFGAGLVIYWFGYLETLESTPEVNNMFILRTSFPSKDKITQLSIETSFSDSGESTVINK